MRSRDHEEIPDPAAHPSNPPATETPAPELHERDYQLNPQDAAAGAPVDESVTGEEDPGAALEFLVHK